MRSISCITLLVSVLVAAGAWAADGKTPSAQFLGILRLQEQYYPESAWTREASEAVGRHFVRLQECAKVGKVILAGRTDESNEQTIGIVIFEADSLEEARRFMANDPAVIAGIMTAEVRPYSIAVSRSEKAAEPGATDNPEGAQ